MKKGWEIKKLSEIGNVFNGNSINAKIKKEKYSGLDNGLPYIGTKDVGFDSVIDYENGVKIPFTEKEHFKIAPPHTPLICAEGGSAGRKVGFTNQEVCFGNKLFGLIPNKNVDSRFLFYYYFSSSFQENFSTEMAGIIGGVSMNKFKSIEIPLPPLHEQQRIVSILDEAFAAIDKAKANAEQNLKNAKELFESYLQGVFEKKGDGWAETTLGEIAFVKSGGTPLRHKIKYWSGDIAWYSSGELNNLYTSAPERHINELAIENSNAKLFPKGSLLIGMYDTAALKMSVLDRDAAFNQAIAGVKPNPKIDLIFILHAINAIKPDILNLRRGVRQKNLSLQKIKNIPISIPPLKVQQAIVHQFDILRAETQKLEALYQKKINDLEELKKSILQKAFAGELETDTSSNPVPVDYGIHDSLGMAAEPTNHQQ